MEGLWFTCSVPVVSPKEPYSNPPKVPSPGATDNWDGDLVVDGGIAELRDLRIADELPLGDCVELHLLDCELHNTSFANAPEVELHIERTSLSTCDLSQARIRTLISSTITGGKLVGTDLSGATMSDVVFQASTFRYLSLRMADLTRVAFIDSDLSELDLYDSTLTDVAFEGSKLVDVSIDSCQLDRVDFRDAEHLGLTSTNSMKGSIISEDQVLALAFQFALSSGVDIDSPEAPEFS